MVSDLAYIQEDLRDFIRMIADMEKVYQVLRRASINKGLRFLMLLPDITAKVSGEPVDLLEVLDVMAEKVPAKEVLS
jgi:hypothetical protein